MPGLRFIDDIDLFPKWALCARLVGEELWVGSMAGEIAALDLELKELRRWQAHEGSVNRILSNGTTYGGDGLVKDRDGAPLAGPFKKPVAKIRRFGDQLLVGTNERALYIDGTKHPKIAAWHVLEDGRLAVVRQVGSKAGDLGPVELDGVEIAPPAWALSAGPDPSSLRAYLKSGDFIELTLQAAPKKEKVILSRPQAVSKDAQSKPLPWTDPQGPPTVIFADTCEYFIGNHHIHQVIDTQITNTLRLPTKGLYGSTLLPTGHLAIAAADGNLKVIALAA